MSEETHSGPSHCTKCGQWPATNPGQLCNNCDDLKWAAEHPVPGSKETTMDQNSMLSLSAGRVEFFATGSLIIIMNSAAKEAKFPGLQLPRSVDWKAAVLLEAGQVKEALLMSLSQSFSPIEQVRALIAQQLGIPVEKVRFE